MVLLSRKSLCWQGLEKQQQSVLQGTVPAIRFYCGEKTELHSLMVQHHSWRPRKYSLIAANGRSEDFTRKNVRGQVNAA